MHPASLILALESVTYSPPSSPEAVMADFYMLSYLGTMDADALVASGVHGAVRLDLEDVEHAETVLYPKLREQLLDDVLFAMCCEIRHFFDDPANGRDRYTTIRHRPPPGLSPFMGAVFRALKGHGEHDWKQRRRQKALPAPPWMVPGRAQHAANDSSYREAYEAVHAARIQTATGKPEAVAEFHQAFLGDDWNEEFGGEQWAAIAAGWLQLYRAKSLRSTAVAIDHVYDLQHNTGTVFNKLQRYYRDGGYGWIERALDFKANLRNIRELLPKCSSQMRRMALPALQAAEVPRVTPPEPEPEPKPEPEPAPAPAPAPAPGAEPDPWASPPSPGADQPGRRFGDGFQWWRSFTSSLYVRNRDGRMVVYASPSGEGWGAYGMSGFSWAGGKYPDREQAMAAAEAALTASG